MKRVTLILGGFVLLIFLFAVLITQTDETRQPKDVRLIGSFQMTDSPSTILTLRQGYLFTLENHLNGKYYGDGDWETNTNDITRLILNFENGESLTLKFVPEDSSLVSENISDQTIILRRQAN